MTQGSAQENGICLSLPYLFYCHWCPSMMKVIEQSKYQKESLEMSDSTTVTAPTIVGIRHRKGDTALNWRVDKASWHPSGDLVRISCLLRDVYTDIDVVTV